MTTKNSIYNGLPVLFGFFIMGFVDVVGIATNYVKKDFQLTDTMANLLPMTLFFWFAVLAVPTGIIMNKLGRKNTVLLSMLVTFIAMLLPVFSYSFPLVLMAFALLGIGAEEAQAKFGFLLDAFRFGAPPHAGFAFGVDRLVALLAGEESIREVIAFPKTQSGSDPLTGAPSPLDPLQLRELGLTVKAAKPS